MAEKSASWYIRVGDNREPLEAAGRFGLVREVYSLPGGGGGGGNLMQK